MKYNKIRELIKKKDNRNQKKIKKKKKIKKNIIK